MPHVLVIEADEEQRESLGRLLEGQGIRHSEQSDGGLSLNYVTDEAPDLIIVAEEIQPVGGVELLPLLRRKSYAPIIMLGVGSQERVVKALLEGADMYLARPFSRLELLGRLHTMLRRAEQGKLNRSSA